MHHLFYLKRLIQRVSNTVSAKNYYVNFHRLVHIFIQLCQHSLSSLNYYWPHNVQRRSVKLVRHYKCGLPIHQIQRNSRNLPYSIIVDTAFFSIYNNQIIYYPTLPYELQSHFLPTLQMQSTLLVSKDQPSQLPTNYIVNCLQNALTPLAIKTSPP